LRGACISFAICPVAVETGPGASGAKAT
jgi:hypothetical protein